MFCNEGKSAILFVFCEGIFCFFEIGFGLFAALDDILKVTGFIE